jgi:phospho-N-acetylmuramoyl-pentapeptide-transferase
MSKVFIAFAIAIAAGACFTGLLLPFLRRLKAGQTIREEGPEAHKSKAGTPTMGGIAILFACLAAALIVGPRDTDMGLMLVMMFGFGLIGFCDDFLKVVKHNNLGLKAWQKFGLQVLISVALAIYRSRTDTLVWLPILNAKVNFGWAYIPFVAFVSVAMSNGVNLTDGLDGLASGVTAIVAFTFGVVSHMAGASAPAVFSAALAGACVGFLFFNRHPAKVFMGDTGSLALGGALAAAAIISDMEILLPIIGIIYVAEALSVIIQVYVFQTQNGRRFFRMAPIHHHFELGGWKETKVVAVFCGVTLAMCVLTLILI